MGPTCDRFFTQKKKETEKKRTKILIETCESVSFLTMTALLDSEQLVSYEIQSFQVTDRLDLQPIADIYRSTAGVPEFPSDVAPLVRARKAPAVLKTARVSVPLSLLESMEDIEIAPCTHELRGKSVAITTQMSSGWVGASRRAAEMRARERGTGLARQPVYFRSGHAALHRETTRVARSRHRDRGPDRRSGGYGGGSQKTGNKTGKKKKRNAVPAPGRPVGGPRVDKPSLFLGAHLDFDRLRVDQSAGKENSTAAAHRYRSAEEERFSVVAQQAQFAPLKGHPLSYLPKSRLNRAQKRLQEEEDNVEDENGGDAEIGSEGSGGSSSSSNSGQRPVLLADGLAPGTGAWGVSQGVHWDDFTETTRNLLQGSRVMHKSVLSHKAVM